MAQVEEYIQGTLRGKAYIAVHLRIGSDWVGKKHGFLGKHPLILGSVSPVLAIS